MGARWGSRVVVLALAFSACVPTPAGREASSTLAGQGAGPTPSPTPTESPPPFGPTPSPSFVRPTPTPSPDFVVYEVRKGDTLETIAKRFKTSALSISYWNRVTYPSLDPESRKYKPDRIEVGWVLQIVPSHEVDPENLPTLTPAPTPKPSGSPGPSASPSG
jgi:hypothetical protein